MNQPIPPATAPSIETVGDNLGTAIDIHRLVSIFRRRQKLFVAVAALVFAAATLITLQQEPKYTAVARVLIDQGKPEIISEPNVAPDAPVDENGAVETEAEILRSRSIAEAVAAKEHLFDNPDWIKAVTQGGMVHNLLASVMSLKTANNPALIHQQIVDLLAGGLDVKRAGYTFMIDVSYAATSPETAARFANLFANAYITDQIAAKYQATQQASEYLSQRLDVIRQQVNSAEAAVQAYKASHNLLSAQGTTLTEQEVSTLDQQLALARAEQAEQEAKLTTAQQQLSRGSNGEDVGAALDSPVIQGLRQQLATDSQQVADLEGRYGPRHPDLLKARRELADVQSQIQSEIGRIISNLQAQVEVARQHTNSVEGSVAQMRGTLANNDQAGVELNVLQRNADAANQLYQSFIDRFKQTTAQQGMEQSNARVVSSATIPTFASQPKVGLDLSFGVVAALIAAVFAIIAAEIFDSGITTADDIEHDFGLPALGSIPTLASVATEEAGDLPKPYDYIVQKPLSGFAEVFRTLRSSLLLCRPGRAVKLIAITSSLSEEGKTTSSFCLARISALSGDKTIVIDCDLRRRGFNAYVPEDHEEGLIEVLSGKRRVEDVTYPDKASGANILPLGRSPYTPRDLFSSSAMQQLLTELSKVYDFIILDTPPVLAVADTRAIVNRADAVVVLVRWRSTPRKAVESSLKILQSSGSFIAGVALSQVDQRQQSKFGYGDPAYYYGLNEKYYSS